MRSYYRRFGNNSYNNPYGGPVNDPLGGGISAGQQRKEDRIWADAQDQKRREVEEARLRKILDGLPKYKSALDNPEFKQLQSQAFGTEDLPVYAQMMEQARLGGQQELQNVDTSMAGQQANVYGQLAMSGGLQGGARERLASQGLERSLAQRQQSRLGTQQSLMGIGSQQADKRMQMQGSITDQIREEAIRKQGFQGELARQRAQFEADLLKSRSEERIANISAPRRRHY